MATIALDIHGYTAPAGWLQQDTPSYRAFTTVDHHTGVFYDIGSEGTELSRR